MQGLIGERPLRQFWFSDSFLLRPEFDDSLESRSVSTFTTKMSYYNSDDDPFSFPPPSPPGPGRRRYQARVDDDDESDDWGYSSSGDTELRVEEIHRGFYNRARRGDRPRRYSSPESSPPPVPIILRRHYDPTSESHFRRETDYYRAPSPRMHRVERERERLHYADAVDARRGVASIDGPPPGYHGDRNAGRHHRRTKKRASMYDLGARSDGTSGHNFPRRMPDPPEWREPKHKLPDGSVTQLLLIHSAEHKTFHDKKEKIALICPDHLKRADAQEISPIKLRWL